METPFVEKLIARLTSLEEKAGGEARGMPDPCKNEFNIYGHHYNKLNNALKEVETASDAHQETIQRLLGKVKSLEHRPVFSTEMVAQTLESLPEVAINGSHGLNNRLANVEQLIGELVTSQPSLYELSTSDIAQILTKRLTKGEILGGSTREDLFRALNVTEADVSADGNTLSRAKRRRSDVAKHSESETENVRKKQRRSATLLTGRLVSMEKRPTKRNVRFSLDTPGSPGVIDVASDAEVATPDMAEKRAKRSYRTKQRNGHNPGPYADYDDQDGDGEQTEDETPRRSSRAAKPTERGKEFMTWTQVKEHNKKIKTR
ncbi:hypothetical protein K431DRAFT_281832 [Polychaeton citri CBS 116435]|uniref:Uncharacterized protein n=1 Tax=Polychaeton citri CBS 116435 TaxID=1314669 RepID=A0A9P4QEY6_9PEZI|nr:hypothetical protein K431DRAFT_281832 [Polychaeton citri CBS 116435]